MEDLFALALLLYFVPVFVAVKRGHPQTMPIVLLTLFLGWTVLGWLAALIWSTTAITPPPAADPRAPGARS